MLRIKVLHKSLSNQERYSRFLVRDIFQVDKYYKSDFDLSMS